MIDTPNVDKQDRLRELMLRFREDRKSMLEMYNSLKATADEILVIVREVDQIDAWLDCASQSLISKAADEIEQKYGAGGRPAKTPRARLEDAVEQEEKPKKVAPKLEKGKRACSLCREPGHRATSCPNSKPDAVKAAVQKAGRRKAKAVKEDE